jgi:hypothetical protein
VVAALSAGGITYLTVFYERWLPSGEYCGDLWGGNDIGGCNSTDAAWRTAVALSVLLLASLAVLVVLAARGRRARSRNG